MEKKTIEFWLHPIIGTFILVLIIVLGYNFFYEINSVEVESKRNFLSKQTELAVRGVEIELWRFEDRSKEFETFLNRIQKPAPNQTEESLNYEARDFLNSFPELLDSIWVEEQNYLYLFTFDERNNFYASRVSHEEFEKTQEAALRLKIQTGRQVVYYSTNLTRLMDKLVRDYYFYPNTGKFLYYRDRIVALNSNSITFPESSLDYIAKDFSMNLKGIKEMSLEMDGEKGNALLSYHPFSTGLLKQEGSLIFVLPVGGMFSGGVYNTYIFLFLGFVGLLIGTIGFFIFTLKNNLNYLNLQEKNIDEFNDLWTRQFFLLKELKGFIYFHDIKGSIYRVSDEIQNILGYSSKVFTNAFKNNDLNPDVQTIRRLIFEAIKERKEFIDFEYDFTRADGENIRLRIFEKFFYDSEGMFTSAMGICTDITDQYKSRIKLIESEKRIRNLIKSLPDILYIFDNEGIIKDRHLPAEVADFPDLKLRIGDRLKPNSDRETLKDMYRAFQLARESRKLQTVQSFFKSSRGKFYFETRFFPLDDLHMMSISKDITGQKIWEKGLVDAINAADQASKAKSEFLANMSHEIRTPMNGLIGIIDLLERTKLNQEQHRYVDLIKNSGNILMNIIKDILDYSKIEAGKIDLNPEIFDPYEELLSQFKLLSGLASKKTIDFTIEKSYLDDFLVEADRIKLNQIFLNLVGNAIKFTPQRGRVGIHLDYSALDEHTGFLKCEVIDSGIGISQASIDNLSDPFYQIDSSSTKNYQGTGLGLSIAKKLIELMGGEMTIESKVGKGSVFSFSIIVKKIEKEKQEALGIGKLNAQVPMEELEGINILLTEDNDLNLQLMTMMLQQLGVDFEIAHNGKEALDLIQERDFDLILMDVQMPVMNGLEATRAIRELNLNYRPTIIGLSANVFDDDRRIALESGMDDYLTKPIRLQILMETIARYAKKGINR